MKYVVLDKKVGETPLGALEKWRSENPLYATTPAAYAGRLDPMASGKLLILLGEECKRQRAYTNLDKAYEIEVLFDIGSDTGDILGVPTYAKQATQFDTDTLDQVLQGEIGEHTLAYPAFSSKTVGGKPLFLYALEGALGTIEIPTHTEHIYSLKQKGVSSVSSRDIRSRIIDLLTRVPRTTEPSKQIGEDFRIERIRGAWESLFANVRERDFIVLNLRVICGSGTYMRSLAPRLGEALGTKALALSITRTRIGTYFPLGRWGFWTRTYV